MIVKIEYSGHRMTLIDTILGRLFSTFQEEMKLGNYKEDFKSKMIKKFDKLYTSSRPSEPKDNGIEDLCALADRVNFPDLFQEILTELGWAIEFSVDKDALISRDTLTYEDKNLLRSLTI